MRSPARLTFAIFALVLACANHAAAQSLPGQNGSRLRLPPDTPFIPLDGVEAEEQVTERALVDSGAMVNFDGVPALPSASATVVDIPPPARMASIPAIAISAPVPAPHYQPQPGDAQMLMSISGAGMNSPYMTGDPAGPAITQAGLPYSAAPMAADPYCVAPGAMSGMGVRPVTFSPESFLQTPLSTAPYDPAEELATYRQKYAVPLQRPWVEFWRPFYTPGMYPPANDFFGTTNLLFPHFYVYGDYRTGVGVNRNQAGNARSWAHRLNLDMDLGLTATERIHGFMGPLDKNNQFTRLDFSDNAEFEFETDATFDTLYFEGDMGAIAGGLGGIDSPYDLPFTFGLVPLLYQNGIWMEDAVLGAAVALPARHSRELHWSNFDATFFAVGDQLTSDAFAGSNSAAEALGTAWFIDAYDGYIELDYAYVHDDVGQQRSYNNFAVAYTRRYLMHLSNSVRFLTNFGQDLPAAERTADGYLIMVENSLISSSPNTFVPYCNLWYGSGRPQSVARAAGSGGILRNTGINFETDGLTGYPTLDPTAANTYGAALGLNILGANFRDQLVVEGAALGSYGSSNFKRVAGDQYAVGVRYQRPLSHRWLFRTDSMFGFLRNEQDIFGNRIEFRWKF